MSRWSIDPGIAGSIPCLLHEMWWLKRTLKWCMVNDIPRKGFLMEKLSVGPDSDIVIVNSSLKREELSRL
jgi:hypothetical protein